MQSDQEAKSGITERRDECPRSPCLSARQGDTLRQREKGASGSVPSPFGRTRVRVNLVIQIQQHSKSLRHFWQFVQNGESTRNATVSKPRANVLPTGK